MIDQSDARMVTRMVAIDDLRGHPLNSNVMDHEFRHKLKAHIEMSGRYPHVVVRPHPQQPGAYEILDGHHRVKILQELGHTEVRCDVWNVDDREARLLLATLNRLEGQDLPLLRAQLIHELLGDSSVDDLAKLLPESDKQIEELLALMQFPAAEMDKWLAEEAEKAEKNLPHVLTYVVSKEQLELIEQAVELASDGVPGRDRKARGLANLAEHFLQERDNETTHDEPA